MQLYAVIACLLRPYGRFQKPKLHLMDLLHSHLFRHAASPGLYGRGTDRRSHLRVRGDPRVVELYEGNDAVVPAGFGDVFVPVDLGVVIEADVAFVEPSVGSHGRGFDAQERYSVGCSLAVMRDVFFTQQPVRASPVELDGGSHGHSVFEDMAVDGDAVGYLCHDSLLRYKSFLFISMSSMSSGRYLPMTLFTAQMIRQ